MHCKLNSEQIFRFFVLVISLSFLAACGGSGSSSDDAGTGGANGGDSGLGQVTVNGDDASIIGTTFTPNVDASSALGGEIIVGLTEVFSLNARTITLELSGDGTPNILLYGVLLGVGSSAKNYRYIVNCASNDCSGFSANIETKVVTLNNVVFFKNSGTNDATGNVTLNGTLNYTL